MKHSGTTLLFTMVLTSALLTFVISSWQRGINSYLLLCDKIEYERQFLCTQSMLDIGIAYAKKNYASLTIEQKEKEVAFDTFVRHLSSEYSGGIALMAVKEGILLKAQLRKNKDRVCSIQCIVTKKGDTCALQEWCLTTP